MTAPRDPVVDEASRWLLRLRGPVDETTRREFESWLGHGERHARAWRAAQRMWALSAAIGPARPVAANGNRRRVLAVAALAVAACVGVPVLPTVWTHWRADHVTATGESRDVVLADGSSVQLDSGSAVTIAYTTAERRVELLSGQAFFQVAANPDRPFVVAADSVAVTVTGTAFGVGLDDDAVKVEVEQGRVNVAFPQGEAGLVAGQGLVVHRHDGEAETGRIAAARVAPWRRGRLLADDVPLAEVVAEIGRYRPGLVVIADADLGRQRVTGVFDLHDPLRALRTAAEPHAGKVREITPWLTVISAR